MLYVWVVDVRRLWCRTYSCGIQDSGATTAGITNNDNLRSDGNDTVNFPHKEKACEESHCAWKKEQRDEYNKGCLPFTQKTRVEILFVYDFFCQVTCPISCPIFCPISWPTQCPISSPISCPISCPSFCWIFCPIFFYRFHAQFLVRFFTDLMSDFLSDLMSHLLSDCLPDFVFKNLYNRLYNLHTLAANGCPAMKRWEWQQNDQFPHSSCNFVIRMDYSIDDKNMRQTFFQVGKSSGTLLGRFTLKTCLQVINIIGVLTSK